VAGRDYGAAGRERSFCRAVASIVLPRRDAGGGGGLIALAVIAAVGTTIGLLVTQPWKPPPLLAPVGVRVTARRSLSVDVPHRAAAGLAGDDLDSRQGRIGCIRDTAAVG
jgi:hypothetical protein